MSKQAKKFVIGGILIVGIAIALFSTISSDNMTYYHTPSEILKDPEQFLGNKVRVMGLIKVGSVTWAPKETKLGFEISEDGEHFLKIAYIGSKPDMFKEGQGVVVEGALESPGLMKATKLLVKHSEEYKAEGNPDQKGNYYKSMAK